MKRGAISLVALLVGAASAAAADLPTRKAAPAREQKSSCFASLNAYFDSAPADCPLNYWGLTFYATIDMGVGYETHGVPFNRQYPTGVEELISKNSNRGLWELTPGGISQSQVGVKAREPLGFGWSFVGEVATGFDPYSLQLANGPGSMVQNTGTLLSNQTSNGDSSRAGQWYNSLGYAGFSNDVFGALTAGRQNSLTLDGVNAYDPMGGSYAFSPIGYSGKTAGAGSTEDARINTSVKYAIKYNQFRASAIMQFGGYSYGNGSNGDWEVSAGGDFNFFNGTLSVDGIYTKIKDQVALATYNNLPGAGAIAGTTTGAGPSLALPNALKATISNNQSVMLLAKYKWNQLTVYGGWERIHFTNPSDSFPGGFTTIGGYTVAPGGASVTAYSGNNTPLNFDILWTGVKYAINERLDITGAYYLYDQHDFNNYSVASVNVPATCGSNPTPAQPGYKPQGAKSPACAGWLNAFSAELDWRPVKRVDLYAGFMYSRVTGGLATGYLYNSNVDPTVGVRVRF